MRELRADRFHTGVRLASFGAWIAALIGLYLLGRLVWAALFGTSAGLATLLLVVGALLLAQPLAQWGERRLIELWPSGRAVQLEPGGVALREKEGEVRIDLTRPVNYWRWRFVVRNRRGGRVPNGHHCAALRLAQGDASLSAYTFLAPKAIEAFAPGYAFYEVLPQRPKSERDVRAVGRDAAYLAAEKARWESGAEIEPAEFEALLTHLAAHLADFPSSSIA